MHRYLKMSIFLLFVELLKLFCNEYFAFMPREINNVCYRNREIPPGRVPGQVNRQHVCSIVFM